MDIASRTPNVVDPGAAGSKIPLEPWNGSPQLSDLPALRRGLREAPAQSAQELACLLRLGCALRYQGGWEGAAVALRARRLARRLGAHSARAIAAAIGAACYLSNARDRLAWAVAHSAVRRCHDSTHPSEKFYLQSVLACALLNRGQLSAAADIYLHLLNRTYAARLIGLRALILDSLGSIGSVAGLHRQARRFHLAAQRASAVLPVWRHGPRVYNNNLAFGLVRQAKQSREFGQAEVARLFALQAIGLARDAVDYVSRDTRGSGPKLLNACEDTLAQALYLAGLSGPAMAVCDSSRERLQRTALSSQAMFCGQGVQAQISLDRGDPAAAIAVAAPTFVRLRDEGVIDSAMDLATILATAHERLDRWDEACIYRRWIRKTTEQQGRERLALGINDLADKLELGRGDLMPYLAHELRSPLASVLALLDDNHGEAPLTAAQRGEVQARVAQALETAERVLEYARLQSLRRVEQQTFDLFALLDDACDEVGLRARARGARIVLEPSPEVMTTGERTLLLRTVVGLLDNALRHSPAGGTVRVRLEALPYCIRLSVEDEGPGFDLDAVAALFDRNAPLGREHRINLGLPLAARVIALHDGALLLDNQPHGGAKVLVALPLATA
jgi:signal transduction histidine kinase